MQKTAINLSSLFKLRPLQAAGGFLANKVMRPAVGRVMTNLVEPFGYNVNEKLNALKQVGWRNAIKSVWNDKPIYQIDDWAKAREVPNRMMYGLKPRWGQEAFTQTGKNQLSFNPNSELGKGSLKQMLFEADTGGHSVLGNYAKGYDRATGSMKYYDKWDFGLNHGEKLTPQGAKSTWARWIMSKLTKPVDVVGNIPIHKGMNSAYKMDGLTGSNGGPQEMLRAYIHPDQGKIPSMLGIGERRLAKFNNRLNHSLERYMNAAAKPGLAPDQIHKLNNTFNNRFRLQQQMKSVWADRAAHQKASVTFDGAQPKYLRPAGTLEEAVRGTQYEQTLLPWIQRAKAARQYGGKALDVVDRSLVPGAALGVTGMGVDRLVDEPPPVMPKTAGYNTLLGGLYL